MGLIKGEALPKQQRKEKPEGTESHLRSILKGITWRIIATTTIIIIAWLTTGNIELALQIGVWEFLIKLALYYLHERAWQLVPRGSVRNFFRLRNHNG